MRKMFLLFGVLALVGVLFVACSDQQDLTSPEEAAFGKNKVSYECTDPAVVLQKADLEATIEYQYMNNKAEKGALENVDNMGRNICKDPPDLAAARATYFKFEIEVNKQNVNKLLDGEAGRQEVLAKARAFVSGIPFDPGFTIPPEALLPTGGVGVFDPAVGGTVYTNNFQAALKADPNQFPGTDPVVIVLTRLPDPDSQVGSEGVIPGYLAFPLAYNVEVNRQPVIVPPDPGVLVALCVVTDYLPDGVFDQLVIGHKTGPETGETWTPAIKYGELSELLPDLYCGDAVADPPASALAAAEMAPEWLKFAGRLLEPVAKRLLDVQPINAYFAGTGLGGRGNSVSPFAAVDGESATIPDPVIAFDYSDTGIEVGGSLWDYYYFTMSNWADYPAYLFEYLTTGSNPSRTWLSIYNATNDARIYGFTAFDTPDDLASGWWFAVPTESAPPCEVYVQLEDQATGMTYRSNTVTLCTPPAANRLTVGIAPSGFGTVTSDVGGINCITNTGVCETEFDVPTDVTLYISADDFFVVNNLYDNNSPVTLSCGVLGSATGPQCEVTITVDGLHSVSAEIVSDPGA